MVLQFDYPIDIPMATKFLAFNNVNASIFPQMIRINDNIDNLNNKVKEFIQNVKKNNCLNSKVDIHHVFYFGEIYRVYFPEQNKKRPCIIYQTDDKINNNHVLVIPITTQIQRSDLADNFIFSINNDILRYVNDTSNIDTNCSCTLYAHNLQPIYKNQIYEFIGNANDNFMARVILIMNKILPTTVRKKQVQDIKPKILPEQKAVQDIIPTIIPKPNTGQNSLLLHKLISPSIIATLNNISTEKEKINYLLAILGLNTNNKNVVFLKQIIYTALSNDNKDYDSLIYIQRRIYSLKISYPKLKLAISKCINSLNIGNLSEINFIYILVSLIKNNMEA